jgi:hypothetical protein
VRWAGALWQCLRARDLSAGVGTRGRGMVGRGWDLPLTAGRGGGGGPSKNDGPPTDSSAVMKRGAMWRGTVRAQIAAGQLPSRADAAGQRERRGGGERDGACGDRGGERSWKVLRGPALGRGYRRWQNRAPCRCGRLYYNLKE